MDTTHSRSESETRRVSRSIRNYYSKRAGALREQAPVEEGDAPSLGQEQGAVCTPLGCGDSVGLAALRAGEVVLDLGSGAGQDVLRSAREVGPDGFVYGLEMTDEMLAVANHNASAHGLENLTFLQGVIEDIPLPDDSVDVVCSNCVINLSVDKERTLQEAFRVLRPGGRLALADIVLDGGLDNLVLSERRIRSLLDWTWSRCIAGALTVDEYHQLLLAAGFTDIEVQIRQHYTVATALAMAGPRAARFGSIATWLVPRSIQEIVHRFTSSAITARVHGS